MQPALKVVNSKGERIVLNAHEQRIADYNQKKCNALGYEVNMTSLSSVMKLISQQKFFEIFPADYFAVRAGEGAWSSNLLTYRDFAMAGTFEEGLLNLGSNNARLATADSGIDALTIQVQNWGKNISYSIMELQIASKSGNWDLISSKERARKRNWDLGIQKVAFLGAQGLNGVGGTCLGLLNQAGITTNTTIITQPISSLPPSAVLPLPSLQQFSTQIVEAYRSNSNRTCYPNRFVVPESDYNGMAAQTSPSFPMLSILELLEKMFKVICKDPGFKILPLAYADAAYNNLGVQKYVLLRYDEESLRMDIPVPYQNTLANSLDNFMFQNVGYGQFTGALAYRPLEMMYFQYPNP